MSICYFIIKLVCRPGGIPADEQVAVSREDDSHLEMVEMRETQEESFSDTNEEHDANQNQSDVDGKKEAAEQSSAGGTEDIVREEAQNSDLGVPITESYSPR